MSVSREKWVTAKEPVGQRAERLISIAHPDFREELYNYARESGFTVRKAF